MQRSLLLLLAVATTFALAATAVAGEGVISHDFCIVGGGPGGLQTAFFMKQLKMNFVVFERDTVGAFFKKYPIHRQLISINKVHTGRTDPEFNMRHDWNSLLDSDVLESAVKTNPLRFKNFSRTYYPPADKIVEYMEAYVDHHALRDSIREHTSVVSIFRHPDTGKYSVFTEETTKAGAKQEFHCKYVVMATGKDIPNVPNVEGIEELTGYQDLSTTPGDWTNKEVLVFGNGNSCLEFIQAVEDETAFVMLGSRYPLKMAHQTHYVGHARAVNLGILDRYQLKSMDALLSGLHIEQLRFRRNATTGKIHSEHALTPEQEESKRKDIEENGPIEEYGPDRGNGWDKVVYCFGFRWDRSVFAEPGQCPSEVQATGSCPIRRDLEANPERKPTPTTEGSPLMSKTGFPVVASNFESVNLPNFYVAGTLMHYRDFKKSAGGFIHGFRYLCRTLAHQLNEKENNVPYPMEVIGGRRMNTAVDNIVSFFATNFGNVSSLWQMQGVLSYAIVRLDSKQPQFGILPDIPLDQVRSTRPDLTNVKALAESKQFVTISFEFGPFFQGAGVLHHQGQEEPEYRQLEKQQWTSKDDPDDLLFRRSQGFEPSLAVRDENEEYGRGNNIGDMLKPVMPFSMADDDGLPTVQEVLDQTESDNSGDGLDGPEVDRTKQSNYGYQFLHPVVRYWERTLDPESTSGQVKAEVVFEHRLREDLHNDWTFPDRHLKPLKNFLHTALRQLQRPKKD